MKCILFIIVSFFNKAVQYVSSDSIYIISTPDSPCPGAIMGQPCFTLQQYVANPSRNSNITLLLYPGNHRMDHAPLSTLQISSFTMRATKINSATIMCGQLPSGSSFWFAFNGVQTVNISDITFNGCKISLALGESNIAANVVFVRNSFVNNTRITTAIGGVLDIRRARADACSSVVVQQCTFSDNRLGKSAILHNNGSNLTVDQSIFKNNYVYVGGDSQYADGGGAISHSDGYLSILNSTFNGNEIANSFNGGAIYITGGCSAIIANSYFSGNRASGNAGAVYGIVAGPLIIINSSFSNNIAVSSGSFGGAIYASSINITSSIFSDNRAGSRNGHGGAIYLTEGTANVTNSYFSNNEAGGHGGAIAINITKGVSVSNTTFTNNTASVGGGGAIYAGRNNAIIYNTKISLLNSTFCNNAAAYCGVIDMNELYHSSINVNGNTFTYNRAVGQVTDSNGGGVICARNASVSVMDNNFSHNVAAGDVGVLKVDESDVTIEKSTFNNNTAGSNGGVLCTYFYPTNYKITNSSFTNNQAGGDGGVIFVGRAGSQVKVTSLSTFSYNSAKGRGGVIAIAGSALYIDGSYLCKKNGAKLGRVVSACKSKVVISNPELPSTPDPIYSFCTLYACSNSTYT